MNNDCRVKHLAYLRKRFPDLAASEWTLEREASSWCASTHPAGWRVTTFRAYDYRSLSRTLTFRHQVGGGKPPEGKNDWPPKSPSWVYPAGMRMPKLTRPLIAPGTEVLYFGRARTHRGHRCQVAESWVKVVGSVPKNCRKYRLLCLDCGGAKLSMEDGGFTRGGRLVELPVTVEQIAKEQNTEVRRAMIEAYGQDRYLMDAGASLISQDDWGKLWRLAQLWDEDLVMVEMVNSTPEPDGSYKSYFERVPPSTRTPLQGLAWQADMSTIEYAKMGTQT